MKQMRLIIVHAQVNSQVKRTTCLSPSVIGCGHRMSSRRTMDNERLKMIMCDANQDISGASLSANVRRNVLA